MPSVADASTSSAPLARAATTARISSSLGRAAGSDPGTPLHRARSSRMALASAAPRALAAAARSAVGAAGAGAGGGAGRAAGAAGGAAAAAGAAGGSAPRPPRAASSTSSRSFAVTQPATGSTSRRRARPSLVVCTESRRARTTLPRLSDATTVESKSLPARTVAPLPRTRIFSPTRSGVFQAAIAGSAHGSPSRASLRPSGAAFVSDVSLQMACNQGALRPLARRRRSSRTGPRGTSRSRACP